MVYFQFEENEKQQKTITRVRTIKLWNTCLDMDMNECIKWQVESLITRKNKRGWAQSKRSFREQRIASRGKRPGTQKPV